MRTAQPAWRFTSAPMASTESADAAINPSIDAANLDRFNTWLEAKGVIDESTRVRGERRDGWGLCLVAERDVSTGQTLLQVRFEEGCNLMGHLGSGSRGQQNHFYLLRRAGAPVAAPERVGGQEFAPGARYGRGAGRDGRRRIGRARPLPAARARDRRRLRVFALPGGASNGGGARRSHPLVCRYNYL